MAIKNPAKTKLHGVSVTLADKPEMILSYLLINGKRLSRVRTNPTLGDMTKQERAN